MNRERLERLEARRERLHRQRPELALASADQAAAWLAERMLVTLTPGTGLPDLASAVAGKPVKLGSRGFAGWPEGLFPLACAVADDPRLECLPLADGRVTWVLRRLLPWLDVLARREEVEGRRTPSEERLLELVRKKGPVDSDKLGKLSKLEKATYDRARRSLERRLLLVGEERHTEKGYHVKRYETWDAWYARRGPAPGGREKDLGLARRGLLLVALRAAVLVPEKLARSWFAWPKGEAAAELDLLVESGEVERAKKGRNAWLAPAGE